MRRALIATLPQTAGGVTSMVGTALRWLAESGYESTVAWYEPYSWSPRLSVPAHRLGSRRVSSESREVAGAVAGHAVGAWLPELEFTHYWPTRSWRQLIAEHDLHLVVSGTCLAGLAFARTGTPFLAWIASDWHGDRKDRVRQFPLHRRWLDRAVVRPVTHRLERQILRAGEILALSEATQKELDRAAGRRVVRAVLPPPIDLELFSPSAEEVVPGRVGFLGRFSDPRKNMPLFLELLATLRRSGLEVQAEILGDQPSAECSREVARLGLTDRVHFRGFVSRAQLAASLRRLDLVVVTSYQEGLGIAALEAMASGCPVVSTRCGGPEEFVVDGESGFLTGFDPADLAARITDVVAGRSRRHAMAQAARSRVEDRHDGERARQLWSRELEEFRNARRPGGHR